MPPLPPPPLLSSAPVYVQRCESVCVQYGGTAQAPISRFAPRTPARPVLEDMHPLFPLVVLAHVPLQTFLDLSVVYMGESAHRAIPLCFLRRVYP
jgi:hypothetical protein